MLFFRVIINSISASFKCQILLANFFTESLVWVSERRLNVCVSGLKRVLSKTYIGLGCPVVLYHCGLELTTDDLRQLSSIGQ